MTLSRFLVICFYLLPSFCFGNKKDILFQAQKVKYQKNTGNIEALGDVFLSDGSIQISADHIFYDGLKKDFQINGGVSLFTDGNILSTQSMNLSADLEKASAPVVYILTEDNSRLTGRDFIKEQKIQVLKDISYSPCPLCMDRDGEMSTTWQLHATQVTRDEDAGDVYYENMWMELFNVPIFYSPFFMHVDPAIKRRSGLLSPKIGYGTYYGFMAATPYYINLAPDRDLVITPFGTTGGGAFLTMNYRQLFENGQLSIDTGVGYTDNKSRGTLKRSDFKKRYFPHFFSQGAFALSENWRLLFDIRMVRSKTYLKRYSFLDKDGYGMLPTLVSSGKAEGFYGKSYAAISAYGFQDLQERANKKLTPTVVPRLVYQYVSQPGAYGQYATLDLDHIFLTREAFSAPQNIGGITTFAHPQQMERFSILTRFTLPLETRGGSFYTFNVSALGRFYRLWDFKKTATGKTFNGNTGDLIPKASIHWRCPYYRLIGKNRLIIEPVISGVLSIKNQSNKSMPNEDSQDFELDATTLFLDHRFPGIDAPDVGQRVNYGMNFYLFSSSRQLAKVFVGQSYSFTQIKSLPSSVIKGIDKGFSDIVTSVQSRAIDMVYILGSVTLSRRNLTTQRAQISLMVGPPKLQGRVGYVFIREKYFNTSGEAARNQMIAGVHSKLDKNWIVSSTWAYDLGWRRGTLSYDMQIAYQNECFKAAFVFVRSFFRDGSLKPGNTFMFTLNFKNIGDVTTGPVGQPLTAETKRIHGI